MKKNKLAFYSIIVIIVFILLIAISLVVVWTPKKSTSVESLDGRKNVYSYIDNTDFQDKTFQLYKSEVDRLLMPVNVEQLYEKTNKEFLSKYKLTKENYKSYLEENKLLSNDIEFTSYSVVKSGDTYIYRAVYDIVVKNSEDVLVEGNIINIIEEKPYVYTLSFEKESLEVLKHETSKTIDGIKFEIKNVANQSNSAKFEIKITNNNDKDVLVDFDDINNVVIGLENGKQIKMAATIISAEEEILTKGSSLKKEAFFNVSLKEQGLIRYIKFNKVTIGSEEKSIKVEF